MTPTKNFVASLIGPFVKACQPYVPLSAFRTNINIQPFFARGPAPRSARSVVPSVEIHEGPHASAASLDSPITRFSGLATTHCDIY